MKILTLFLSILMLAVVATAQWPRRTVERLDDVPLGWIVVGSSGQYMYVKWTIADATNVSAGQEVTICHPKNVEGNSDWERVSYIQSGLGACGAHPPGGIPKGDGWIYRKRTGPKSNSGVPPVNTLPQCGTVGHFIPCNPNPLPPLPQPPPKRPEDKAGTVGFYTRHQYILNLYIYLESSAASQVKRYGSGGIQPYGTNSNFAVEVDQSKLVYAGKIDRYFRSDSWPVSYKDRSVNVLQLTEGTYRVITWDLGSMLMSDETIKVTDGQSFFYIVKPDRNALRPWEFPKENSNITFGTPESTPAGTRGTRKGSPAESASPSANTRLIQRSEKKTAPVLEITDPGDIAALLAVTESVGEFEEPKIEPKFAYVSKGKDAILIDDQSAQPQYKVVDITFPELSGFEGDMPPITIYYIGRNGQYEQLVRKEHTKVIARKVWVVHSGPKLKIRFTVREND